MATQTALPSTIDLTAYSDALVVLATAGILIPIVRRLGINPVLGYLAAGALLGPAGLGTFRNAVPALYWVTVVDAPKVDAIAELGVVFLLFLIGLELSFDRLKTMRRLVVGLGGLQIMMSTALLAMIAIAVGLDGNTAIIVAASLSLSSTAIVLEILSHQGRLATRMGRASFSVLLAQDIAVIPILLFVSAVGGSSGRPALVSAGSALLQAGIFIGAIVVLGRTLMRPLFRLVASVHSSDLFIAAVLFVIIGAAVASSIAGISMALGAFVAGLLLAETEFVKAIQSTVEPFKGLLLGVFFFSVGMSVDVNAVAREPLLLFACLAGLVLLKALLLTFLGRMFGLSWFSAIETGLLLGPGGEFAFVGITQAASLRLLNAAQSGFLLVLTAISLVTIPLLSQMAQRIRATFQSAPANPELTARPPMADRRAIVVGYGRFGAVVCDLMQGHAVNFVAIDRNPQMVMRARQSHPEVYYGNAADAEFLKVCGIDTAPGIIVTVDVADDLNQIVATVRRLRPDIPIVARARDAAHARQLYSAAVTDAVPETIEASLQVSEAALVMLGVPMGPAIASIHEKRDEFRRDLQQSTNPGAVTRPAKTPHWLRSKGI